MELRLGEAKDLLKKRHLIEDLLDEIPAADLPQVEYMDVSSLRKPVIGGYDLEASAGQQNQENTQENTDNGNGNVAPEEDTSAAGDGM